LVCAREQVFGMRLQFIAGSTVMAGAKPSST